MKQQIANRLGVAHVRDTVIQLVAGTITREQAMESLEIGKTRLYELKASYLAASRMPSLPQGMRRIWTCFTGLFRDMGFRWRYMWTRRDSFAARMGR